MQHKVSRGFVLTIAGTGFLLSGCAWHQDVAATANQALAVAQSAQATANQASSTAQQAASAAQQAQLTAASAQQSANQAAAVRQAVFIRGPRD